MGDDAKAELVVSAATALTEKIKDLFAADGIIAGMVAKAQERGPSDFPKRRRVSQSARFVNGDEGANSLLLVIIALLLIIAIGVGVGLYKLSNIEKGLNDEQRRTGLERNSPTGAP